MNYREPDDENSLRARIDKAEAGIAALRSPVRRAMWEGWHWLGWALLACGGVGMVLAAIFHGSASGVAARGNAEREAIRWGRAFWPTLMPGSTYCASDGACLVRFPDHTQWRVGCDTDALAENDGCANAEWVAPTVPAPIGVAPKSDAGVGATP